MEMKEKNNYCLYFHINLIKKEIFYVGIGDKKRPYSKKGRSKFWHNIVNKYGYSISIIKKNLTWDEACKLEIYFIKFIGRRDLGTGTLCNLTNGGDGIVGQIVSDKTRKKQSIARQGKKFGLMSEEGRRNLSIAHLGQSPNSGSFKEGYKMLEKTIKKISNSLKGNKRALGNKLTKEQLEKRIIIRTGMKYNK